MTNDQKQITVAFYRTNQGNEPVREWLKALELKVAVKRMKRE